MTHASVFSGIGGPEVAAAMLGWQNLFHCEINPFGRKVLDYWFPDSKSYEDITTTDFSEWRGRVNVLTGGFPCQPFSYAGQRRGADDDRYLWPYMFRCIDQVQPDWVVAENVAGILTMVEQGEVSEVGSQATLFDEGDMVRGYRLQETFTLQRICDDLESHGYSVQPILIPACAVGAPHRRDRVFVVGHRIASDTNDRADGRTARKDEGESRAQRLQERHEVRKPDEPNQIRREGATIPEDTVRSRQLERHDEEQGSERNIGNTGARGGERLRGEISRIDSADTLLRGSIPPRKSETSERDGAAQLSEQNGQRQGHAPSGHLGLSRLSRNAPHPDSNRGHQVDEHLEPEQPNGAKPFGNGRERNATDTEGKPSHRVRPEQPETGRAAQVEFGGRGGKGRGEYRVGERWANFPTVSPVHRGNDGIPFPLDCLTLSPGKWRTEALKAYGNAIVPQVMYEIFRAIESVEKNDMVNP